MWLVWIRLFNALYWHQKNEPKNAYVKNRSRVMPPRLPIPAYCCLCRVLKRVQYTRLRGQIIDGGDTRKRRAMPPIEKPMSCVDITRNHWSRMALGDEENKNADNYSWSCRPDYNRLVEPRWCLWHMQMNSRHLPKRCIMSLTCREKKRMQTII